MSNIYKLVMTDYTLNNYGFLVKDGETISLQDFAVRIRRYAAGKIAQLTANVMECHGEGTITRREKNLIIYIQ